MMMTKSVNPRTVAVAIPYKLAGENRVLVCLVSSRKHPGDLVLPKGGVEAGEDSLAAAIRELYEEAGLVASEPSGTPLSRTPAHQLTARDHKPHKDSKGNKPGDVDFVPRAVYVGHQVQVIKELDTWLEADERQRYWFTPQEALERVAWRKDIASIFQAWSQGLPAANNL